MSTQTNNLIVLNNGQSQRIGSTDTVSIDSIALTNAVTGLAVTANGTFGGTLGVTGNATVGGTLGVTGTSTLAGLNAGATAVSTLSTSGAATLNSASITNNATVGGTLGVTGASTLASASITNNATVGGTLGVTGAATFSSTLGAGATSVTTLATSGAATLNSASVVGNATIGGTLAVTGASTLASASVTNNATVGGTLAVTGASTFAAVSATTLAASSNATIGGTFGVTGATTLSSTLGVTGAATLSSTLGLAGDLSIGSGPTKFSVAAASGNTSFLGDLAIGSGPTKFTVASASGNTTLAGSLSAAGIINASAAGTGLAVTNNATIGGTLAVTGTSVYTGDATFNGDVIVNGTLVTQNTTQVLSQDSVMDLAFPAPNSARAGGFTVGMQQGGASFPATASSAGSTGPNVAPTITLTGDATAAFAAGDIISAASFTDAASDGYYEINGVGPFAAGSTVLTLNGVGSAGVSASTPFVKTNVANTAGQSAVVSKVNLSVLLFADGTAAYKDPAGATYAIGTLIEAYHANARTSDFSANGGYTAVGASSGSTTYTVSGATAIGNLIAANGALANATNAIGVIAVATSAIGGAGVVDATFADGSIVLVKLASGVSGIARGTLMYLAPSADAGTVTNVAPSVTNDSIIWAGYATDASDDTAHTVHIAFRPQFIAKLL